MPARLDDLVPGTVVRGLVAGEPVTVVAAEWNGARAMTLTYRRATGEVGNELVYRADEGRLEVDGAGAAWAFDARAAPRSSSARKSPRRSSPRTMPPVPATSPVRGTTPGASVRRRTADQRATPRERRWSAGSTRSSRSTPDRLGPDAGRVAQEVVAHLQGIVGTETEVTIEFRATNPDGFPEAVVKIVSENASALRFGEHGLRVHLNELTRVPPRARRPSEGIDDLGPDRFG